MLPRCAGDALCVTYAEVDNEGWRIARLLSPLVNRECVVAVLLSRTSPLLFAAQLGVLRAGAAFVCLDEACPPERLAFLLEDLDAVAVLCEEDGAARIRQVRPQQAVVDVRAIAPAVDVAPDWLTPSSLAYLIYTSGTTGRPKGVMIEHRSIVHLVQQGLAYFDLGPKDRCVQVSAPVYDSSLEETWLPLAAGATVVVADDATTRLGPDFLPWLREQRATVLMPTPTLLRMTGCKDPAREVRDLRLVYAGGEAMPQDLVDRWAPALRFENGYGPTECTVTILRGRLHRGQVPTIGSVLPGNEAWLLGEALEVLHGEAVGELCIGGVQVGRGYWKHEELTRERFPVLPGIGRVYRTGDLVRRTSSGDFEYLGRVDSQVKLRGYRIELEEIEARLAALPGVHAAACRVSKTGAAARLEAFFVPTLASAPPSDEELKRALATSLPAHMVPTSIVSIDALPTLVSGKLDRKALPDLDAALPPTTTAPAGAAASSLSESGDSGDSIEAAIRTALSTALDGAAIGVEDDFFAAGGDSLAVAMAVSDLRENPMTEQLSARDFYEARCARRLAHLVRERSRASRGSVTAPVAQAGDRVALVTGCQIAWLLFATTITSLLAYVAIFEVAPLVLKSFGLTSTLLLLPGFAGVALVLYTLLTVTATLVAKRVLIGAYRPGRTPIWTAFYARHWIVVSVARSIPWDLLRGTVLTSAVLRLLGARVGKRLHVHRGVDLAMGAWDLLTIGDDVTLSQDASIGLVHLEAGQLVMGTVTIEDDCTLEVRAGLGENTRLARGTELAPLSYLATGTTTVAEARYDGVPAQRVGPATKVPTTETTTGALRHGLELIAAELFVRSSPGVVLLGFLALLLVILGVDAATVTSWLDTPDGLSTWHCFILVGVTAFALAAQLFLQALLLRVLPRVPSTTLSRWSRDYILVWLRTGLLQSAGDWLSGSLYWRWWLRIAGMRLGKNCEVSTIIDVLPEQVSIGDESFFADGIYLCGPVLRRGSVLMGTCSVGERVFLGNHVVVPPGTKLENDILVGVSTVVDDSVMRAKSSWFGHPAFELPRREVVELDRALTHEPTALLFVNRLLWETLRFAIPSVAAIGAIAWIVIVSHGAAYAPLASLVVGMAFVAIVCALKWLLLGRVQPGQHGFWSSWCARWDFLYMAWGRIARGALAPLGGTLLMPVFLRAMGVKVGKRVVLSGDFAQVVDPDMLAFGDAATIDRPLFQAHSFEDRVLKIAPVSIGDHATVERATVLFYGAQLGRACHVKPHSVVMKNERLSPGHSFEGAPTRPT